MNFLIMLNLAILITIAVFLVYFKLNALENLFIIMVVEFLITSFCAILYININVWDISRDHQLYFVFRLYEILVIPLLYLLYFNLLASINNRLYKWIFTVMYVNIIYGVELLLVKGKVISYKEWQSWQSFLLIAFIMTIVYILLQGFRRILRKEGVG